MKIHYMALLLCASLSGEALSKATLQITQLSLQESVQTTQQKQLQILISEALAEFESTSREQWSYKVSRYENEEGDISSRIEIHDASKPDGQRWQLASIDGKVPSDEQQRGFAEQKAEQATAKKQKSISVRLGKIIQIETLQVATEDEQILQATFDVSFPEFAEKATENLTGHLTYNKSEQFIETIEIINNGNFSPMLTADISDFKMVFVFQRIDKAILPLEYRLSMKGTYAFFAEINELSRDTFSDYRFIAQ